MGREFGIDRFTTKYGLAAENVAKAQAAAINRADREARRQKVIVGIGNCVTPPPGSLNVLRSAAARLWKNGYLDPGSTAVYVIGEEAAEHVKIGFAKDPFRRLKSLQTANYRKLYLLRIFWFRSEGIARGVEKDAHLDAEDDFERTEGEWFKCGQSEAHKIVEAISDRQILDCCVMTPMLIDGGVS